MPSVYGVLLVLPLSADSGIQLFIKPADNGMYERQRSGQPRVWSSWIKLTGAVI